MKQSAGLLVFRWSGNSVEVLLAHPGGPFWAKKDSWSAPKGVVEENEDELSAAKREFKEETGFELPISEPISLGSEKDKNGKVNCVWAVEGNPNLADFKCVSMVKLEWPPRSGEKIEFSEVDKVAWFDLATAKRKIFKGQIVFIDRLAEHLKIELPEEPEQQTLV